MKKKDYIIQVAPLIRLPLLKTQVFSYFYPEPIAAGSLVEIPFYNRTLAGIVVASRSDFPRKGNFEIKPVKKVSREKLLSEKQIELAKEMAGFYLSPLGTVLKSMVPKIVKAKKKKKADFSRSKSAKNVRRKTEITGAKEGRIALIGPKNERDKSVLSAMRQTLEEGKQFLYLASEIFPACAFFEELKKIFPDEKIALLHGNIPRGEYFENWKEIKSGKKKIIVASKVGVFLPFFRLGTVVVEESGDVSHKQWDMAPRYNAAETARMLADLHKAKLVFSNSVPSAAIWEKRKENNFRLAAAGAEKPGGAKIKVADIFKEKKDADFPIGKELHGLLADTFGKKKKSLLVVNRKGFSNYSVCQGCKSILRCPDCDRALVYFEEKEKYKCLHCPYGADLLSACPSCGACRFSHQGIGIQLVEKKTKRLFPKAKILKIDADVSKSRERSDGVLRKLAKGDFDILIGTQIALKIGNLRRFDLVAFPDFDNLGSLPDFNTRELVFLMLAQARGLTKENGDLLLQTSRPDDPLLTFFQSQSMADFFEKELQERRKTGNPPFSRLVKIAYRDKIKKRTDIETRKIFGLLEALSDSNIDISDPYSPFAAKKGGYWRKNLLIKSKPGSDLKKSPVFSVLGGLRKGWTIDADPASTV